MAGFKVKIGADAVQLSKTLAELEKDLAQFKKQLSTATNAQDVIRLNQAIAQTDRAIKNISGAQSLGALNTGLARLPVGAGQATTALTNMGRVVSDAPFGFIAISNNIDPLIQSFIQLKAQSGSSSAALKALGSSLIGGGGIALAFSVVTSVITLFSTGVLGAKKELQGFAKAQSDANKEAGEQIAHLRVLAAVSANTANTSKDRKQAAEQLSKSLKEQNVQLSAEEALNNKAAAAIDTATKAILARAKARAIESRIAELTAQNLDREIKRAEATEKLRKPQAELNKLLEQQNETLKKLPAGASAAANPILALTKRTVDDLKDVIKDLDDETAKSNKEINALIKQATTVPGTGGKDAVVDLLKKRIDALQKLRTEAGLTHDQTIELAQLEIQLARRDGIKSGLNKAEIEQEVEGIIQKAFPNEVIDARFKIRVLGELDTTSPVRDLINQLEGQFIPEGDNQININTALGLDQIDTTKIDGVVQKMRDASAAKKELFKLEEAQQFAGFITDNLGPIFTDLFANLTTDSQNAFKAFAKAVGDLIKRLIAAAVAAAALSAILNAIFPGLGGTGKASFGAIFGQLTGLKFADGGITQGPTAGFLAKVHPNEAIIPLSRLPQLIGSAGGGGGIGGEMKARFVDGGRDLFIIMEREGRRFGRMY